MPIPWRYPTICLILLSWAALLGAPSAQSAKPRDNTSKDDGSKAVAALEGSLVDAIAKCEKSVVAIARVKRANRQDAEFRPDPIGRLGGPIDPEPGSPDFVPNEFGAGVVVDRRGLILTHYQLLGEDCDYYITTADRKTYRAAIKGADPRSDLAILSIDAQDLPPIPWGDATKLKKGNIVIALGNPYGIARDGQASASWGIVANFGRKAPPTIDSETQIPSKPSLPQLGTLIQTDAKLNLGTTGGALINLRGEMVGLTVSLAAGPGFEQAAGYALPVDETFRRVVDTLKQGREVEYGLLGVAPQNLDARSVLAGKHGARIDAVFPGAPAEAAGLRSGDIVTEVNGQEVFDADSLVLEVGKLPVAANVRLTVAREADSPKPIQVQLAKYFVPGKKIVTTQDPTWRGLRVDYPTAVRRFREHALADLAHTVVVTEVEPDSPAAAAGFKPEMFISRVGGVAVTTPQQFQAAIAGKEGVVDLEIILPDFSSRFGGPNTKTEKRSLPAEAPHQPDN